MKIINRRNNRVVSDSCDVATSFVARALGLMGRTSMPTGGGLLIRPCSSVHCFFMRFPIDVAFLDGDCRVRKVYNSLRPWRISTLVWGAKQALELPAGTLAASGTRVGDQLIILS